MILNNKLILGFLTSLVYSVAAGPISFGEDNPQNNTAESKLEARSIVEYDADIHGPQKGFRLAFESSAPGVTHPDGSFNYQAHLDAMDRLIARENANIQRQIEAEIIYQDQPHDVKMQIRKRHDDHERRAANFIALNAGINYQTQLFTTLSLGTPAQAIVFDVDVTVAHTLAPKACFDSPIFRKRDGNANTCPVSTFGFNVGQSTTASVVPGLFYDTDYSTNIVSSSAKLHKRALTGFPVEVVKDVIAIGGALIPVLFWVFGRRNNARLQPAVVVQAAAQIVAPAAVGILGLAAPGLAPVAVPIIPDQVGTVLLQYFGTIYAQTGALADWVTFSEIQNLADPLPGNKKRSTTIVDSAQVAFGPVDPKRCSPVSAFFPVVSTAGFSQKLLWQLALKSVQVGPSAKFSTWSSIQVTPTGKQAGVSVIPSASTIQYDPSTPYIYLSLAAADAVYAAIPGSRKPTITNPYYSYYCRNSPSISFEFVDASGTSRLLTMRQQDWFLGLSLDLIGYCNGAVQALPTGANSQTLGMSFTRSFCTSLGTDHVSRQASTIGFAIPLPLTL